MELKESENLIKCLEYKRHILIIAKIKK